MRLLVLVASIPLLLSAQLPATTQQTVGPTIVVKGTIIDPAQARQRAVEFVNRAGVAKGEKQVARWLIPICIKVIGLQDTQAARVEQIMRGIAQQANMRIAGSKCEPNITASFTADAKQVVRQINSRKPHQLRELSLADRERVLTSDAPVRWWYSTQMVDRDGVKANNTSAPWLGGAGWSGVDGTGADPVGLPTIDEVTTTQQYNSGSNVRTPTLRSLFGATVVVDAPKAGKTPIDAIAAYVAMVAFAEMDAADPPPPDSVLGLFQPNSLETALTDWDMAFLKSLYRMPLDRRARIQRGHLVEALLDERLPDKKSARTP
ncbi:MAG: hypothetical protein M3Q19_12055 [Pseudomonadota bacterium]|nr:hypothetical protein [Pseudomonadota bacterium]